MHILLMILGALSTIGVIIWRINTAMDAARQVGDVAKTAANLPRLLSFRRKTGKRGSQLVTDFREAAVILMLEIARAKSELTQDQKSAILSILVTKFEFSSDEADDIVAQASWVSQDESGTDALVRKMTKLVAKQVDQEHLPDLEEMLNAVATCDGAMSAEQYDIIHTFRTVSGY